MPVWDRPRNIYLWIRTVSPTSSPGFGTMQVPAMPLGMYGYHLQSWAPVYPEYASNNNPVPKPSNGKSFTIDALLGTSKQPSAACERASPPHCGGNCQPAVPPLSLQPPLCPQVAPHLYTPNFLQSHSGYPVCYYPHLSYQEPCRGGFYTQADTHLSKNSVPSFKHKPGKSKRMRTIFTNLQLSRLEKEFARQQYMVGSERFVLASSLQLTEAQVGLYVRLHQYTGQSLQPFELKENEQDVFISCENSGSHDNNPYFVSSFVSGDKSGAEIGICMRSTIKQAVLQVRAGSRECENRRCRCRPRAAERGCNSTSAGVHPAHNKLMPLSPCGAALWFTPLSTGAPNFLVLRPARSLISRTWHICALFLSLAPRRCNREGKGRVPLFFPTFLSSEIRLGSQHHNLYAVFVEKTLQFRKARANALITARPKPSCSESEQPSSDVAIALGCPASQRFAERRCRELSPGRQRVGTSEDKPRQAFRHCGAGTHAATTAEKANFGRRQTQNAQLFCRLDSKARREDEAATVFWVASACAAHESVMSSLHIVPDEQRWVPTHVQVTVLRARGLRAKGKHGTSDVYTIIQVGKEKFSTSVVEKTTAPEWKEECSFELLPGVLEVGGLSAYPPGSGDLVLTVMHRALIGLDVFLGQATIPLDKVFQDGTSLRNEWYKLHSKSGKKEKERGEVQITVQFTRNNLTASMYDLSMKDKSRSTFGKLKDKMKGKKRGEVESASAIVPSGFGALSGRGGSRTASEGGAEEEDDEEGGPKEGKKNRMKNFFQKNKLRKSSDTRSNTSLGSESSVSSSPGGSLSPTAGISVVVSDLSNSPSNSSSLTVDSPVHTVQPSPRLQTHKRAFSDEASQIVATLPQPRSVETLKAQSGALSKSSLCINGSHVYNEPTAGVAPSSALPASLGLMPKSAPLSRSLQNLARKSEEKAPPDTRRWSLDKPGKEAEEKLGVPSAPEHAERGGAASARPEGRPVQVATPMVSVAAAADPAGEGKKHKLNLFSHGRSDSAGKGGEGPRTAEQSSGPVQPPAEEKHKGWFGSKDGQNKPSLEVSPKVETSSDAPFHLSSWSPDHLFAPSPASAVDPSLLGSTPHVNPFTPSLATTPMSPSNPFFISLQCNPFFEELLADQALKSATPAPYFSSSPLWASSAPSSWPADPGSAQDGAWKSASANNEKQTSGLISRQSSVPASLSGSGMSGDTRRTKLFPPRSMSESTGEWDESFDIFAASRLRSGQKDMSLPTLPKESTFHSSLKGYSSPTPEKSSSFSVQCGDLPPVPPRKSVRAVVQDGDGASWLDRAQEFAVKKEARVLSQADAPSMQLRRQGDQGKGEPTPLQEPALEPKEAAASPLKEMEEEAEMKESFALSPEGTVGTSGSEVDSGTRSLSDQEGGSELSECELDRNVSTSLAFTQEATDSAGSETDSGTKSPAVFGRWNLDSKPDSNQETSSRSVIMNDAPPALINTFTAGLPESSRVSHGSGPAAGQSSASSNSSEKIASDHYGTSQFQFPPEGLDNMMSIQDKGVSAGVLDLSSPFEIINEEQTIESWKLQPSSPGSQVKEDSSVALQSKLDKSWLTNEGGFKVKDELNTSDLMIWSAENLEEPSPFQEKEGVSLSEKFSDVSRLKSQPTQSESFTAATALSSSYHVTAPENTKRNEGKQPLESKDNDCLSTTLNCSEHQPFGEQSRTHGTQLTSPGDFSSGMHFLHDGTPLASSTPSLVAAANSELTHLPSPVLCSSTLRPATGTAQAAAPSSFCPPPPIASAFAVLPEETQPAEGFLPNPRSSPHPVKPLSTSAHHEEKKAEGRSVLASGLEKLKSTIAPGRTTPHSEPEAERIKSLPSDGAARYYHLTHDELITLVLEKEAELEKKGAELKKMAGQVHDLEDYIDSLLVRIMEQTPTLLQVKPAGK
ncbi:RFIP5 protein, partial [Atractosteus spatula]|nr:RFIP5 protein [Atractosteus spatula]